MFSVFLIWLLYLLILRLVSPYEIHRDDNNTMKKKKIHIPRHITEHKPVLCWVVRFRNGVNTTIDTEPKDSRFTFISSVGDLHKEYHIYCHKSDENLNDGHNPSNFHQSHHNINNKNQSRFLDLVATYENHLENHAGVKWYSQETVRSRQKRAMHFDDPFFSKQWHLVNRQMINKDINVTGVWERNITGHGVTVAVVDDGVEWTNPDLRANYNFLGSWDLNDDDSDPMPSDSKVNNHHGTRCAGEIAAVANDHCGVGVAYNAKISGLRVLDGPMTDSLEASAFNKKLQVNDIYSCSWGPDDDGKTVDGPHIMAAKAMKYGVDFGRRGYGSIFVVASGNGGRHQDNCNFDGYANSIYTVTIGAVDEIGHMPYYAEECASMLGVTFSSGKANNRDIVTTDWTKRNGAGCTERHTGTSAAAPLAAGMIALMLQVQPCLTWRDVQYIIILTALKVDVDVAHWQRNGAGLYHSHKHGFGLLKAWRLVNAAKIWETVPWMTSFTYSVKDVALEISKGQDNPLIIEHTISDEDMQGYDLYILEYVQITVTINHPERGKLSLQLKCPSGTNSVIAAERPLDTTSVGFSDWTFTTVRCWGEQPVGKWILTVSDSDPENLPFGYVQKWRLRLFGTPMTPEKLQDRRTKIEEAMSGEFLNDSFALPCRPPPAIIKSNVPISIKSLKILVLICAFCVVMAIYETFEYAVCYNEEKKEHKRNIELAARAENMSQSRSNPLTEEDVTESTGLLQGEDIAMTLITPSPEERNDSILQSDLPLRINSNPNNITADRPCSGERVSDINVVPNNMDEACSVNIGTETSSVNAATPFETLSLSDNDDEEITAFDIRTAVKSDHKFDWLKYTKNR